MLLRETAAAVGRAFWRGHSVPCEQHQWKTRSFVVLTTWRVPGGSNSTTRHCLTQSYEHTSILSWDILAWHPLPHHKNSAHRNCLKYWRGQSMWAFGPSLSERPHSLNTLSEAQLLNLDILGLLGVVCFSPALLSTGWGGHSLSLLFGTQIPAAFSAREPIWRV